MFDPIDQGDLINRILLVFHNLKDLRFQDFQNPGDANREILKTGLCYRAMAQLNPILNMLLDPNIAYRSRETPYQVLYKVWWITDCLVDEIFSLGKHDDRIGEIVEGLQQAFSPLSSMQAWLAHQRPRSPSFIWRRYQTYIPFFSLKQSLRTLDFWHFARPAIAILLAALLFSLTGGGWVVITGVIPFPYISIGISKLLELSAYVISLANAVFCAPDIFQSVRSFPRNRSINAGVSGFPIIGIAIILILGGIGTIPLILMTLGAIFFALSIIGGVMSAKEGSPIITNDPTPDALGIMQVTPLPPHPGWGALITDEQALIGRYHHSPEWPHDFISHKQKSYLGEEKRRNHHESTTFEINDSGDPRTWAGDNVFIVKFYASDNSFDEIEVCRVFSEAGFRNLILRSDLDSTTEYSFEGYHFDPRQDVLTTPRQAFIAEISPKEEVTQREEKKNSRPNQQLRAPSYGSSFLPNNEQRRHASNRQEQPLLDHPQLGDGDEPDFPLHRSSDS